MKVYDITCAFDYGNGMAIVAANSEEDAARIFGVEELTEDRYDNMRTEISLLEDMEYFGKEGVITAIWYEE